VSGEIETRTDLVPEAERAASLEEEKAAEQSLLRAVIRGAVVAVPVCIIIWCGIVALAVGGDDPDWGIWIGMGVAVGTVAGVFFGGWAGFIAKAHLLDEVDRRSRQTH